MINKHIHWRFIAGKPSGMPGQFLDATIAIVLGSKTEEEALAHVKTIVADREAYHLAEAWECVACSIQEQQMKSQTNYFERILKSQGIDKKPWEKKDEDE